MIETTILSEHPTVSIIIAVFNKVEITRKCLEALKQNTPEGICEVIIIDNASTDGTKDFLDNLRNEIKLITNRDNMGYTIANNQGAKIALGKYLAFLNNDAFPQKGWLDFLMQIMEKDPDVGAVGAKLIYPDGRLQEAGAIIFSDGNAWNFGKGDHDADKEIYNDIIEVDYCSSACLLVRREFFQHLGGFDERYTPAYYEDSDLCFGIRKLGYKVMFNPKAIAIHHEAATAGIDAQRLYDINRTKFTEKWEHELLLQDAPQVPTTANRMRLYKDVAESDFYRKLNRLITERKTVKHPFDRTELLTQISSHKSWYHQIEIAPGIITPGVINCSETLNHLDLPNSLEGKRVLDIGAADGFFSFEAEKRGAKEVIAIDYLQPDNYGFSIAAELLNSRVIYLVENIYNLSLKKYGYFDIIFFLGVIYHLPDPMLALRIIRKLCKSSTLMILESYVIDNRFLISDNQFSSLDKTSPYLKQIPIMQFYPADILHKDYTNYWMPNTICMRQMLIESNYDILREKTLGDRVIFICKTSNDEKRQYYIDLAYGKEF